jgi:hypothetical protein
VSNVALKTGGAVSVSFEGVRNAALGAEGLAAPAGFGAGFCVAGFSVAGFGVAPVACAKAPVVENATRLAARPVVKIERTVISFPLFNEFLKILILGYA